MTLDPSIPFRAGQAATVNLADMYAQAQNMQMQRQAMDMRQQQFDYERQQAEAQAAERQKAAQREQMGMIARLTRGVGDEATYQQRLAAARQYGVDVSSAPANFDPEWVQTQNIIAETFLKPDGEQKLTTTAQELRDAGFTPGTPEFIQAMRQRLALQDSKVVTTQAGGMAGMLGYGGQYQPFVLPNDGSGQAGAPVGSTASLARPTSKAELDALPPGTQYIAPDGSTRRKGGGVSNGTGNFRP